MTARIVRTAKEIIELGVEDPILFVAMALFEEGFGPDHISDMTVNVILADLLRFNHRVLKDLGTPLKSHSIQLRNGSTYQASLPTNTYVRGGAPIVLVPTDILRDLPIAKDWDGVAAAASRNATIRNEVNTQIARIWQRKTLRDKAELRRWALSDRQAFETLLEIIHGVTPTPYDVINDPTGEIFWRRLATDIADKEPFRLIVPPRFDHEGLTNVVKQIIEQFGFLIEKRRYSEELYYKDNPRPERAAQRLFFAVAYAYCKANNLDITPEADTGNGPVDFKVSRGFTGRVLVEIKLSTNKNLVKGYLRQLAAYEAGEEAAKGFYLVIDVGGMGQKAESLISHRNVLAQQGKATSEIVFIDGTRKPAASKL